MEPSGEVDDVADVAADEIGDESAEAEPVEPEAPKSMRDRLARARGAFSDAIGSVLGRSAIDDSVWEELEDALLIADVGISVATSLLDPLRERVEKGDIESPDALIASGLFLGRRPESNSVRRLDPTLATADVMNHLSVWRGVALFAGFEMRFQRIR